MRLHNRSVAMVATLVAALAMIAFAGPNAGAASQDGEVTYIYDGDTLDVDPVGSDVIKVRTIGINTLEVTDLSNGKPKDPCTWDEAAENRLNDLIPPGSDVTLSATDLDARSGERYLRWIDEGSVDIGLKLIQEGLALPFPHKTQTTRNRTYMVEAAKAIAADRGMWGDDDRCGAGPGAGYRIKLWVNWDADGPEGQNRNGEYVTIKNYGSGTLSLKGWWLRESGTSHYYHFPATASIPSNNWIRVYAGTGTNTSNKFFTGWNESVFLNANDAQTLGDGAYLFDDDGDLRAWMNYPCVYNCSSSLKGKVSLSVRYDAAGSDSTNPNGEWVTIKNVSTSTINLRGYELESYPYVYDFWVRGLSSKLRPGEYMRVYIGKGTQTRTKRFWRKSAGILNNSGDVVKLRTFDDITVTCKAWGSGRCS